MPRLKEVSHPFLNTTFSLYSLSPLYKFPTLDPSEHPSPTGQSPKQRNQSPFKAHERALTNLLKGEVLRGVHVTRVDANLDREHGEMDKLGRFKDCKWRLVPALAALREYNVEQALRGDEDDDEEEEEDIEGAWAKVIRASEDVAGVEVSFDYERGVGGYVAYLIGPPQKEAGDFTKLPLVLTRLPKLLVDVLFEYLASTFDAVALPMGVVEGTSGMGDGNGESGVGWLGGVLEMYVEQTKGRVDKGIALTYRIPTGLGGGVKVITVGLEKGDISGFLSYGKALNSCVIQSGKKRKRDDVKQSNHKGPFLLAVEKHMESTMCLDVGKLVLAKIACGGFIVGGAPSGAAVANGDAKGKKDMTEVEAIEPSGRVKIFVPRKGQIQGADECEDQGDVCGRSGEDAAVEKFMDDLIQLAIRKGGISKHKYADWGDDVGTSNGKKSKQTAGKIPRGRTEAVYG